MAYPELTGLSHLHSGKVRETYDAGSGNLLLVSSDRLSAFDVILEDPIPLKGQTLNRISAFWLRLLPDIVPNHLTDIEPRSVVAPNEFHLVRDRSMVVRKARPILFEMVVRGYIVGSGWKDYQETGSVCGIVLPPGLRQAEQLPKPIFTPATKAPPGEHDQNVSFEHMADKIGRGLAHEIREVCLELYKQGSAHALACGMIIADTKFEFGLDNHGNLMLIDEVLTPDSSRYWPVDSYVVGKNPTSLDKQYVRDYLETVLVGGKPWNKTAPAPRLPQEVIAQTTKKYVEAQTRLCLG